MLRVGQYNAEPGTKVPLQLLLQLSRLSREDFKATIAGLKESCDIIIGNDLQVTFAGEPAKRKRTGNAYGIESGQLIRLMSVAEQANVRNAHKNGRCEVSYPFGARSFVDGVTGFPDSVRLPSGNVVRTFKEESKVNPWLANICQNILAMGLTPAEGFTKATLERIVLGAPRDEYRKLYESWCIEADFDARVLNARNKTDKDGNPIRHDRTSVQSADFAATFSAIAREQQTYHALDGTIATTWPFYQGGTVSGGKGRRAYLYFLNREDAEASAAADTGGGGEGLTSANKRLQAMLDKALAIIGEVSPERLRLLQADFASPDLMDLLD